MSTVKKPTLAVWKFSSCDGCQLTLLDCEDELLAVAGQIEIAYFLEASRSVLAGPYDLSIVEGSITTVDDIDRIREVRRLSTHVVSIGACATAAGLIIFTTTLLRPSRRLPMPPDARPPRAAQAEG